MIVNKNILSYINKSFRNISDSEFINICNNTGIEVEQIIRPNKSNGLIIVRINKFEKHPNSDRLNIVNIQINDHKKIDLVCGAQNLEVGKYAIYAPVGSKLWNGIEIAEREIRGIKSKGMLCGINEIFEIDNNLMSDIDANGIVLLDNAKLGDENLDKYFMHENVTYDVSIPSNRNDLNAHLLFANELLVSQKKDSILDTDVGEIQYDYINLKNIDKEICSDFSLLKLPNLEYKVDWKQKLILMSCGYKIQNNLLDLINLFTIYYGNPIHIYNADEINIKNLSVKQNIAEEIMLGLDGNEYKIPKKSICIYHNDEVINLAGIIGSDKYKYDSNAKFILIEIANFNSILIKKTCQKMKINTKAQALFSKPLSPWITQKCFYELLKMFINNQLYPMAYKNFSIISPLDIAYDYNELYKFLGITNPISFSNSLERSIYHVHPSRLDLSNQYDVFEEVLKTIDVNQIPAKDIIFKINKDAINTKYQKINSIKDYLSNIGMFETKTYNLTSENSFKKFNFFNLSYEAKVIDPISKNRELFRLSPIDEMLKVMQYNSARKRKLVNIYEFVNLPINENDIKETLSMVFINKPYDDKLNNIKIELSPIYIKNLINNLFNKLNLSCTFDIIENQSVPEVHNKKISIKFKNTTIGYIAQVKKQTLKQYDLEHDTYIVIIDLNNLFETSSDKTIKKSSIYPTVIRDINITNKDYKKMNSIINSISKIKEINSVEIIDQFKKDNNVTYTLRLEISSNDTTLNTSQIDQIMDNILKIIK